MQMTRIARALALAATTALAAPVAAPLAAQEQPAAGGALTVMPSGRATSAVALALPGGVAGGTIRVEHGQPHARGREIVGNLIPYDRIWRTGANEATTLTTDVDLELGGTRLPKGSYTLYTLLTRDGWTLIVDAPEGRTGANYEQGQDIARVPLAMERLQLPAESFTITLVPALEAPAQGTIVLRWGTVQGSAPWRVAQ